MFTLSADLGNFLAYFVIFLCVILIVVAIIHDNNSEKQINNSDANLHNIPKVPSNFIGTTGEWFINAIVCSLIVSFSFGIATPYAYCRMIRWTIENTSYNGSKLGFKGKGGDLMGKWLLWMLLSIITFGIYAIWIPVKLDKWRVENTVLYIKQKNGNVNAVPVTNKPDNIVSVFSGTAGGWFVNTLVASLIITFSFGIAAPFAYCRMVRWTQENTTYSGQRVVFRGKGGDLMGKWLLWMLLTIVTCGIYSIWIPVKLDQ